MELKWNIDKILKNYYMLINKDNKTIDEHNNLLRYSLILNKAGYSIPIYSYQNKKRENVIYPDIYNSITNVANNLPTREIKMKKIVVDKQRLISEMYDIFTMINKNYKNDLDLFISKKCIFLDNDNKNIKTTYFDTMNNIPLLHFTFSDTYEDYMAFIHEVAHLLDMIVTKDIPINILSEMRPIFASFLAIENFYKENEFELYKAFYNYYAYIENLMLAIKRKFNYTYDAHILKQEQLNKDKLFFAHYTYIVSFYMAIKLYNIYLNDKDKAFEIYEITRKKPEEDFGFYQDLMNIPNFDLFLKKSVLDLRNHLLNDSSNKIRKR